MGGELLGSYSSVLAKGVSVYSGHIRDAKKQIYLRNVL